MPKNKSIYSELYEEISCEPGDIELAPLWRPAPSPSPPSSKHSTYAISLFEKQEKIVKLENEIEELKKENKRLLNLIDLFD